MPLLWNCRGTVMCVHQFHEQLLVVFMIGWLTEDWTNDRSKCIRLNSDFIEGILHKRFIGVEIAVVVSRQHSVCWMLKVSVIEHLRLSCLLVCSDSTPRRWGWSLCLVQIFGVAVWSGCRYCWIWSMMLQRLDDQCPSCAIFWLTVGVLKWLWSVGASLSSKSLMDWMQQILVAEAVWSMSQFVKSLVNQVCVNVALSVDASPRS